MTSERAARVLGAGLAAACLVALIVIDVAIPGAKVVLVPLFALAPLIACAALSARTTAAFAAVAVAVTGSRGPRAWATLLLVATALTQLVPLQVAIARRRAATLSARRGGGTG